MNGAELASYSQRGVVTPDHIIRTKNKPLVVPHPEAGHLEAFADAVREAVTKFAAEYHVSPDLLGTQPYREVELPSFWIDKYEVTNSQYRSFLKATGHRPPIGWLDKGDKH